MAKNALLTQDPTAYKIAQFLLKGEPLADIAQKLGMTEQQARLHMRKSNSKDMYLSLYAEMLIFELAPLAIKGLYEAVRGDTKSSSVRLKACMTVLDRIGMGPAVPVANEQPGSKPVENMSIAELQAFIADKEAGLKNVTPPNAPSLAPATLQAFDWLED